MITVAGSGPRNAREDGQGRRVYTWQGRELPSVTSIPKLLGIPHRLHGWYLRNLIEYVIRDVSAISLRVATGDDREIASLKSDLRRAAQGEQTARIVGVAIHRAAALGHHPEDVHGEVAPRLRQYLDWQQASGVEILNAEFQVWNLTEGYAGTVDLLARFRDGSVWVVDLKTGKGLYGEHALQLMAYLMAEFVGRDDVVDEETTRLLQEVSGIGVLHLEPNGWEFRSLRPDPEIWTAFRGLLRATSWMSRNGDLDGVTIAARRSAAGAKETR